MIPAATENVITSQNADRLRCRILCEGANGPTTPVADEILADKKVFIIPDILANAGGVTTSYFEWVQDRMGYFWTEAEVNQRLDHIMTESFRDVITYAQTHNVNNRIAAYMLAIDRVAYTTKPARHVRLKSTQQTRRSRSNSERLSVFRFHFCLSFRAKPRNPRISLASA